MHLFTISPNFLGSSSSGRMSTVSGCSGTSLGDSGTHSDSEDRRVRIIHQKSESINSKWLDH